MASGRVQLVDKDLPIHHFPSKPTCLAYDNKAKKLVIGCDNGEIIILDRQQHHMLQLPQAINGGKATDLLLSFGVGKGILLAAHKNKNHLLLWSSPYKNNPTQLELPENETPTVLAWSSAYSTFFVGTTAGKICKVFVSGDNKMEKEDLTASMLRDKCNSAGEVVAIVEEPQTGEYKDTLNVLVVFSRGLCVLWNQQQGCSLRGQIKDADTSVCVPLYAWWLRSSTHVFIACTDGSVRGFKYDLTNKGWNPCQTSSWVPEGLKSVKSITKLQFLPTENSLVYVGGCSSLPTESNDSNNMVSKFKILANEYLPLVPFCGRIADILYLQPSAEQDPSVLAVLTESEVVLLDMTTKPQEIKHSCGTIMLQYPRLFQFNEYPHFMSPWPPITCLQYCGVCSQELLMNALQPQRGFVSDLIVTGHKDGSVRLWLMFYDGKSPCSVASFVLALVVYTAEYYEIPQGQQSNLHAGLKELPLVKVTSNQQYLLVVNKSCHVLLFKLSPHTITSAPTAAKNKPQSQEVILKEVQDAMPPNKALPTTPPHLRSCQWQTHVQLLQHFICYYQSGRGKKLDPVPVNCVEYDEELAMLAVGTNKGLIVLDTLINTLIQVIGSEKKLLEISGRADKNRTIPQSKTIKPSELECNVTCLEAYVAEPMTTPRLTLWVGTAGGALGVFTVTRRSVGESLQLGETGKGWQKDSAIVRIQHQPIVQHDHGKGGQLQFNKANEDKADPSRNDSANTADELQNLEDDINKDDFGDPKPVHDIAATSTTYAVVTTEKQVKCYHHFLEKNDGLRNGIDLTNSLKTGVLMLKNDAPYLVCLLNNGKFDVYSLSDGGKVLDGVSLLDDDTVADLDSKILFSADKNYVVLQNHAKELKLIELKHQ